jgi:predicted AAA+ superfamily ATPase
MLNRKITKQIETHLLSNNDKILVIEGARQIGKSYTIREIGQRLYPHFVEINFVEDDENEQIFKNIHSTEDFYFTLSMFAGNNLNTYDNTLIFIDEIQHYPQYLTLLKFFRQDKKYKFIASGSSLGITLRTTTSIPVGSIIRKEMYQLDFEEFLWANGFGHEAIDGLKKHYNNQESLNNELHEKMLNLFRRYLLVGGMPDAVNEYLLSHNIIKVREVQNSIHSLYGDDASKYETEHKKTLLVKRIYDMLPSQMENKKKRIVVKDIKNEKGARYDQYQEEFEYLISSGIALSVNAISNPHYPLCESVQKNLLKLYLNDVGILTAQLYQNNIRPVLDDQKSINLGSVYESIVAQELKAHSHRLFYYDNRHKGEVDFIINDYTNQTVLPIEVKSGKDYNVHSALNNLLSTEDYNIKRGIVLSNEQTIMTKNNITYLPIYFVMFIDSTTINPEDIYF